ncbi:MAG: TolC family protein [Proteobacteria bacterium]|jgi:outer membrane protein, heavy metal efflux system|uniref:TolC family protein n=1 Tax=Lysobacteraceae TaxID=32033 RepID=UPI000DB0D65C|nr:MULTISPECIES: TolC family protein [Xanthomonadaceae]MBS0575562.1 TolC family protein [Pseudomonadota bacterium]PZP58210.1 MAG: transporter [Pseudoxanthomonas spadix]TMN20603.1 TolC family protein [Pseudoxanthomonas sp. X-1]UAY75785.1 TolC family protein [Pseudoxanthomonas sp. X-1]
MLSIHFVRHPRVTALALFVWGAAAAIAQAAEPPLTLEAAVRQGLARAPQIEARASDTAAAHEEAVRAGRLPDPTLKFGLSNFPVTEPGAFSLRSDGMTMRTIGVTQAIPSRAARTAERSLATAQVDAAEAERVAVEQNVRERIADTWIDVWAIEQRRGLLLDLHDEAALAVRITQARLRGGEGSAVDALAAQAELAALDNRLEATDADLAAAQAGLQRWLGVPPGVLAATQDFSRLPVTADRLVSSVDQQAPLQAWAAREQLAQAALDQARAAKHPDWSVSASYGKRAPGMSDMVMLEVGVSLPLFTHDRQDRGISARQAQRDAVQADHEDARRAQREAVTRAIASWQGWDGQIERYQQTLLPLARDRARTALAGYRAGSSLQPWLDARRAEIELRLNYADALASRARLWASLAYLFPAEVTP